MMTVEEMIKAGDIVEFRKYLSAASDKEVMGLWIRRYGSQEAFSAAVNHEASIRKLFAPRA